VGRGASDELDGLLVEVTGGGGNPTLRFGHEEEMELDDSILWSRSRTGDTDAFALLFERHAKAIYNYCFRRVGDWAAAEDMVSIVFLEAWRRRDKELPPGKPVPWLYGIATNVVRNRRRSERRFAAALSRMPVPQPEPSFVDLAEARLDDERQMKRLLALISQLVSAGNSVRPVGSDLGRIVGCSSHASTGCFGTSSGWRCGVAGQRLRTRVFGAATYSEDSSTNTRWPHGDTRIGFPAPSRSARRAERSAALAPGAV
jgi:RNA polymerase sigma factor (sigma-70 family)